MTIREILEESKTIAVVGCSDNPERDSHKVPAYLQKRGYRIVPVNPKYRSILGEKCYPNMQAIPLAIEVDVVDIFRKSEATEGVVDDVIEWAREAGQKPVIWTQFNVSSDEAKEKAERAGFQYIENRCMKVEYSKALE